MIWMLHYWKNAFMLNAATIAWLYANYVVWHVVLVGKNVTLDRHIHTIIIRSKFYCVTTVEKILIKDYMVTLSKQVIKYLKGLSSLPMS